MFFFDLVLQKTSQHVFVCVHAMHPFLLVPGHSLLELLDFLLLELRPLELPLAIADGRLVFVDVLEGLLVFHELVVVLFVDGVLLRFDLAPELQFFVVLFLIAFPQLLLFEPGLLPDREFFEYSPFLLLNCHFLPEMLIFHRFSIVLMHHFFLLNGPPTLLLGPPPLLLLHLRVLGGKRVLKLFFGGFVILHLAVDVLLVGDDLLEFPVFEHEGLLAVLQFVQKGVVVVAPAYRTMYFTILLLSSLISRLLSWMSRSSCWCIPWYCSRVGCCSPRDGLCLYPYINFIAKYKNQLYL